MSQSDKFEVVLAEHWGMCFGVRDAVKMASEAAGAGEVTILGELVHNEEVRGRMRSLGAREGDLFGEKSETEGVLITAHGASDLEKRRWQGQGHRVMDSTCPLVRKAHTALAGLVAGGCHPVVIGKAGHVEVRGLTGDFPKAQVVMGFEDLEGLPMGVKLGVVSQTTQPIERVEALVAEMRRRFGEEEVEFRDTVCQPTKNRQLALAKLCQEVEVVIVVGGSNSNNSHQLVERARELGCESWRVERPEELERSWLRGRKRVGVTAGTSVLPESVGSVLAKLMEWGGGL